MKGKGLTGYSFAGKPPPPYLNLYIFSAMISISNLEKSYGDRTLFSGVSFQLNSGGRYGLVGANGSGKTTLLKLILAGDPDCRHR